MSGSYKILGVDPGTNILGYAILHVEKNLHIPAIGVIKLQQYKDHTTKLKEIYLQLQEIIETYLPTVMAIETPFYGKNVQSMLKLGRAQGVSIAAAITMGLDISEFAPKKIKKSVTGNGNASKEQVASMLENILRINLEQQYLDATDALAAAYTQYNQGQGLQTGEKRYSNWKSFINDNSKRIV